MHWIEETEVYAATHAMHLISVEMLRSSAECRHEKGRSVSRRKASGPLRQRNDSIVPLDHACAWIRRQRP
jgi:hypothetical protein